MAELPRHESTKYFYEAAFDTDFLDTQMQSLCVFTLFVIRHSL